LCSGIYKSCGFGWDRGPLLGIFGEDTGLVEIG
jgi:hypothetical protein